MNVIHEIQRQFRHGDRDSEWKQILDFIRIKNLRGWSGQEVLFRFPVAAVVGENGTGKSTVLRAAACAYGNKAGKSFFPVQMFVRTVWDETAYANVLIEYEMRQGTELKKLTCHYKKRWVFSPAGRRPERDVFFLDISSTLPLDATAGYAKAARQATEQGDRDILSDKAACDLSYVQGRKYTDAHFVGTDVDSDKQAGLLIRNGYEPGVEISQFHQDAGEHSRLNFFRLLDRIPPQSLLLIDEIEDNASASSWF